MVKYTTNTKLKDKVTDKTISSVENGDMHTKILELHPTLSKTDHSISCVLPTAVIIVFKRFTIFTDTNTHSIV